MALKTASNMKGKSFILFFWQNKMKKIQKKRKRNVIIELKKMRRKEWNLILKHINLPWECNHTNEQCDREITMRQSRFIESCRTEESSLLLVSLKRRFLWRENLFSNAFIWKERIWWNLISSLQWIFCFQFNSVIDYEILVSEEWKFRFIWRRKHLISKQHKHYHDKIHFIQTKISISTNVFAGTVTNFVPEHFLSTLIFPHESDRRVPIPMQIVRHVFVQLKL